MPDTTKRLDLQFGSFACSVRGFDDPVLPVQQLLQALQNLLEETPELADSGISFDAEAIERLIGEIARRADLDEDKIEIVPGLIIVHHIGDANQEKDEAGSEPFVAIAGDAEIHESEPAAVEELEAVEGAEPEYINIFTPANPAVYDAGPEPEAESADSSELVLPMSVKAGAELLDEDPKQGEDRSEIDEADEGYTAASLAKAAGAETVAEFMISAAAWMVLLQGQTTFSRRAVIDVFETIPGEHSKSLEARIKGFGKAVRNGHLILIEDDLYGLSENDLELFQSLL